MSRSQAPVVKCLPRLFVHSWDQDTMHNAVNHTYMTVRSVVYTSYATPTQSNVQQSTVDLHSVVA